MTKVMIVEDEVLVAQRLMRLLTQATERSLNIHHEKSIISAKIHLSNHEVDLVFLDLNLNGKSGFDLLQELLPARYHTIIVSAYTEQALKAFEFGVLDFVGKPFTINRLSRAMNRYFDQVQKGAGQMNSLAVIVRGDIHFIPIDEISYFQAASIYTNLHCSMGNVHLYDKPLNALMQILPAHFFRIHRSYAVDLRSIVTVQKIKHNTYHVILRSGESLPLSRKNKNTLIENMQNNNH
ncbi:MAG: LytTR family DNA-binding domain-containing protein [Cyclobacteriaceae bacterium]